MRRVCAVVAASCLLFAGCSLTSMRPVRDIEMSAPVCTSTRLAPNLDMLYATGSLAQGIGLGVAASNRRSGDRGLLVAGTVLAGAQALLFGISAGQGMRRAKECGEAKREFYRDVTQQLSDLKRESADSSRSSESDNGSDGASESRDGESSGSNANTDDDTSDQAAKEPSGQYVGMTQAAEYCGISKEKVWDAMKSDELEVRSTPTGQKITRSSLETFCSEETRGK